MTTKPPTPQTISRLLAQAGFRRAVFGRHNGGSGFRVMAHDGAVRVGHIFWMGAGTPTSRYQIELEKYAKAIADAGYQTEITGRDLIVTAGA